MDDCIFCKIAKGEAPSSAVAENDHAIAFKSIDPIAEVHVLVVPKKHIAAFDDISDEDSGVLAAMVSLAQEVVNSQKIESGYKIAVNGGKYQAVGHLHWHVLGGTFKKHDELAHT